MKEDIEKLMHSFPLRNGRKEYTSFDEIIEDYQKKANEVTEQEYGCQQINYIAIIHKDKKVLEEIYPMGWPLDAELYVSKEDIFEDREHAFDDGYELKEDETYYIEIVPEDKSVLDFVRYDLCSFARNNGVSLEVYCENYCVPSSLHFLISEKGELVMEAKYEYERESIDHCVYQVCMLREIYGTLENMKECMN